jgi:DNA (cytosine-5)-methyltransferase 1
VGEKEEMLTHGSLFHGIGGFALAARWCGIPTIWECEIDEYCHKLSKQNFPEIKTRYRNIRSMLDEETKIDPVSIISGGFPCQPFSAAGKRGGQEDDRYLWPETIEVIKKVRPPWVILENVPGIINMALPAVLADLENAGYQHETFIVPALSVGAYHRRDRIWIIAHSDSDRKKRDKSENWKRSGAMENSSNFTNADSRKRSQRGVHNGMGGQQQSIQGKDISDTVRGGHSQPTHTGRISRKIEGKPGEKGIEYDGIHAAPRIQWPTQPPICGRTNGVSDRMDRIKALGNAIVPQIALEIFRTIQEVEKEFSTP